MEIDDENVLVKFMAKTTGKLYKWPDTPDVALQPTADLICRVDPPMLMNERAQFKFSDSDFDRIGNTLPSNTVFFK